LFVYISIRHYSFFRKIASFRKRADKSAGGCDKSASKRVGKMRVGKWQFFSGCEVFLQGFSMVALLALLGG
jgi:hypothetical protein